MSEKIQRCSWVNLNNSLDVEYHDNEWCSKQIYSDKMLFELLCLEGAQAGLSWSTILKKREAYRKAFCGFDILTVASFSKEDVVQLVENKGIIRNRLKINSHINNAKCFLKIQKEFGSFSNFIWNFTNGKTIFPKEEFCHTLPQKISLSEKISKELKKRGFTFVGPVIIFSYMQAIGMVNYHSKNCFLYKKNPH